MDAKAEKIALFRYGLIAPLVLEALPGGELTRRAEEIAARSPCLTKASIPSTRKAAPADETADSATANLRNLQENTVKMPGEKIVAHYNFVQRVDASNL